MSGEVLREPGVERCEHVDVCEHACRMWCRAYKPRVDRESLLELVDEIEADEVTYSVSAQYVLDGYARRIREALSVSAAT